MTRRPQRAHTTGGLPSLGALAALASTVGAGCDNPFGAAPRDAHAAASAGGVFELASLFAAPTPEPARVVAATSTTVPTTESIAKATARATYPVRGIRAYGGAYRSVTHVLPPHHATAATL